jgi:anti-sigma regulatory factor (Ser/Thr protein kinase)
MNPAILGPNGRAAWTFPGRPESVHLFRQLARAVAGDGDQADAAALCVSELVTNALVHTRSGLNGGSVTVSFEALSGCGALRIRVQDAGARVLVPARAGTGLPGVGESEYGLGIVAAVAADWGVVPGDDGRSVTWCVIPATGGQQ